MKRLTTTQKIRLVLNDLEKWMDGGDSDCSLQYAFRHGFFLHAASLWMNSGAMSDSVSKQVKGLKINRTAEDLEIKQLCAQAHIYICPSCNHHAFMDDDEGSEIDCSSCLETAFKEPKKTPKSKRPIESKDVVYIFAEAERKATTGVVNRVDSTTGMINVFQKGVDIGIWFFPSRLKRIGRIK